MWVSEFASCSNLECIEDLLLKNLNRVHHRLKSRAQGSIHSISEPISILFFNHLFPLRSPKVPSYLRSPVFPDFDPINSKPRVVFNGPDLDHFVVCSIQTYIFQTTRVLLRSDQSSGV